MIAASESFQHAEDVPLWNLGDGRGDEYLLIGAATTGFKKNAVGQP